MVISIKIFQKPEAKVALKYEKIAHWKIKICCRLVFQHIVHIFAPQLTKSLIKMAHIISTDCTACGTCIDECPVEAISQGDIYKIDPDVCTDCGTCADACPSGAISPA
jgi:ferredoxin